MAKRAGHGDRLSYYDLGRTPFFASTFDARFSYCLFVPEDYDEHGSTSYPLLVVVHGTGRTAETYRNLLVDFATAHHCIVMAPLFPVGIPDAGDLSNYKFLKAGDIRFDAVLLAMIGEIAQKYRVEIERFYLHGFSGGGHFVHRFFYLHPRRLAGLSIAAPGMVTLLDEGRDWWCGVRDFEAQFGCALDYDGMREVPVQTIVGDNDTDTWEITITPQSRFWMHGANDAGATRIDRIASLARSYEAAGISVERVMLPGVAHEGYKALPAMEQFFARVMKQRRVGAL